MINLYMVHYKGAVPHQFAHKSIMIDYRGDKNYNANSYLNRTTVSK